MIIIKNCDDDNDEHGNNCHRWNCGDHTMGERGRIDSIRGHLAFGAAVDNIYLNLILIWDCDNDQIDSLKGHLVISPFKRMDFIESNSETVSMVKVIHSKLFGNLGIH